MESKEHSLAIYNSAEKVLFIEKVEKSKEDEITVEHLLSKLNERFMAWAGELIGADCLKL